MRAHVLLCMLAYSVEWRMRQALAPLLFAEDDLVNAAPRRGIAGRAGPAVGRRRAQRGWQPVHRFRGLPAHLATLTTTTIQPQAGLPTFDQLTVPTPLQKQVFELLDVNLRL